MQQTKGVILAGGKGTRLYPLTKITNKHLLPLFDKPLFFYPLANILLSEIKELIIIIDKKDFEEFKIYQTYFKKFNLDIKIEIQKKPLGILDALKIAYKKLGNFKKLLVILGDNFFYGESLPKIISKSINEDNNKIFTYNVQNPKNYGNLIKLKNNKFKIIEKPKKPKSNMAVTGMYIFNNNIMSYLNKPKISINGEYQITDLNNLLIKNNILDYVELGRGVVWMDTGTPKNLIKASQFVQMIEERQGLKIGCPEEILLNLGFVTKIKFRKILKMIPDSDYKNYLIKTTKNY